MGVCSSHGSPLLMLLLSGILAPGQAAADPAATAAVGVSPSPDVMTYDFPPGVLLDRLDGSVLTTDPMQILFLKDPPFKDVAIVSGWLEQNIRVYDFLPQEVKDRPEISSKAAALGYPSGVMVREAVSARNAPRADAPLAYFPSDTTNGYISEKRQPQRFRVGQKFSIIESRTVNDVLWHKITQGAASTPEQDREAFDMCDNVGGIAFEDFSVTVDPGWIPATATQPVLLSPTCSSGLYTFESVENGDLAVYVSFEGLSFENFDDTAYTLLGHYESGKLQTGARIRLIWCDDSIEWLPFDR